MIEVVKMARDNKYSVYCQEHLAEFRDQLREEANQALVSWPGRIAVILLVASSIITFQDAVSRGNPYATYLLFTYAFPILLVMHVKPVQLE